MRSVRREPTFRMFAKVPAAAQERGRPRYARGVVLGVVGSRIALSLWAAVSFVACGSDSSTRGPVPAAAPPAMASASKPDGGESLGAASHAVVDASVASPPAGSDDGDPSCATTMFPPFEEASQGLSTFANKEGLVGLKDASGKVVLSPRFRYLSGFLPGGVAGGVEAPKDRAVFVTKTGAITEAVLYDNGPDYFVSGVARIIKNKKVGFIDDRGRVVIEPRWDFADAMCGDRVPVCNGCKRGRGDEHDTYKGGKWGYVDRSGREVIALEWSFVERFEGETAIVERGTERLRIDRSGRVLGKAP